MFRNRVLAAGLAGLAAASAVAAKHGRAQPGETTITCSNPVSGASWPVVIDWRRSTVDANPAAITAGKISWFDPKDRGKYTIDRKSGDLTASIASSTGGYFRRGRCDLDIAR